MVTDGNRLTLEARMALGSIRLAIFALTASPCQPIPTRSRLQFVAYDRSISRDREMHASSRTSYTGHQRHCVNVSRRHCLARYFFRLPEQLDACVRL